jgi:hypothetical protein
MVFSLPAGAVCELINKTNLDFDGSSEITNEGTLNVHGSGGMFGMENLKNAGRLNWATPIYIHPQAGLTVAASVRSLDSQKIDTSGVLKSTRNVLPPPVALALKIDEARVNTHDGATLVAQGGGNLVAQGAGNLISQDGGGLISQDGGGLISQDGGGLVARVGGNAADLQAGDSQTATTAGNIIISGGEIDLTGVSLTGSVALEGGVLSGTGLIKGDLTNNGGFVSPGNSAGTLAVTGNFAQNGGGTLIVQAGGAEDGQFDRLQTGGSATLGGKLELRTINGYVPLPNDPLNPLGYNSVTGAFASISSNVQATVNGSGVLATLDPNAPNPPLLLSGAVSRKTHNGLGPFDVDLPLSGNVGVESRRTNANGDHQIVLSFAEPVQSIGTVTLTSNSGSVTNTAITGATVVVDLTGIGNQQIISLGLTNVSNGAVSANFSVSMGVLLGDANGDGSVNSGDTTVTRSRSGQVANPTSFRSDVNTDGAVNSGDASVVRSRSGTTIYP